jgi:uncharacterized protein
MSIYIGLLVGILLLGILYFLKNKNVSFGNRVLIAMALGLGFGAIFKENAMIIEPIGGIYISLIKMLVIPLVVSSLISSVTSLDNPDQLKKIGFKTIALLLGTTAIATVVGILVGNLMDIGSGVKFISDSSFEAREIPVFKDVLMGMIPMNIVNEMATDKIIPVIIFSMLFSIAIIIEGTKNPEAVKPVKSFINSFSKIMFRITQIVIALTPYGVFGLMISISASSGLSTLIPLAKVILAMYVACILHLLVVHGSLIAVFTKINPFKFYKNISEPMVVAFTTRSSYGTLPITIKALKNEAKISDKIVSFVAPLGSSMGMNAGGGIYPALAAIFVAKIFNIDLTLNDYLLLVATTTLGSIGIAGVPGAAIMAATVVLSSLNLPVEGLAMLLGIDVIIDMVRTMTNVTSSAVVTLLVGNSENEFDKKAFDEEKELKVA